MRIALSFPGCHSRGGVERAVLETARYLAERGHDVSVFANDFGGGVVRERFIPQYVEALRWPKFLTGWSYARHAENHIDRRRFDVVNTHGCVCPLWGVHRVHSLHRAWLERSRRYRPAFSASRLRQQCNPAHPMILRMERGHFGQRRYRRVIALTEDVRNDLYHFYDVPPEDVAVVPNGFSAEDFNPVLRRRHREQSRAELGVPPDSFVLLFIANELERKGLPTVLRAMALLKNEPLTLLVVGRCDARAVAKAAAQAGVGNQVLTVGSTENVGWYHAAADLFVLPTQYEAFCMSILEALGAGVPVITSNVPGARDAIRPGVNGTLIDDPRDDVELASAIKSYLNIGDLITTDAAICDSVTGYQWSVVLKRYEEVLLECV